MSDRAAADDSSTPPSPAAPPAAPSVRAALRRTVRGFQDDKLTDWAAALTYYGVLSIFPGLLVLVSLLGLLGRSTTDRAQSTVSQLAPGEVRPALVEAIDQVQESPTAGVVAVLGLVAAFWSASGYVAAFMRAANTIYDVPEGRPLWKLLPIRIGLTAAIGLMTLVSALIVVFTGRLAEATGALLGVGDTAVAVWGVVKWPVLVVLVSLIFETLYWVAPNARHGRFRFISPGGLLAVLIWLLGSAGFAFYVANFGAYNKTYGTLAAAVIFLVWMWLSNLAILLGAELDAELARGAAIAAGHPAEHEPFLPLRDDRKIKRGDRTTDGGHPADPRRS